MDKAEKIVNAILLDLSGRAGIGDELDGCDEDIKDEIRNDLIELVREQLNAN